MPAVGGAAGDVPWRRAGTRAGEAGYFVTPSVAL